MRRVNLAPTDAAGLVTGVQVRLAYSRALALAPTLPESYNDMTFALLQQHQHSEVMSHTAHSARIVGWYRQLNTSRQHSACCLINQSS